MAWWRKQREQSGEPSGGLPPSITQVGGGRPWQVVLQMAADRREQGDLDGAQELFVQVMESGDSEYFPLAAASLGHLLELRGDEAQAESVYLHGVASENPDAVVKCAFNLALLMRKQGRHGQRRRPSAASFAITGPRICQTPMLTALKTAKANVTRPDPRLGAEVAPALPQFAEQRRTALGARWQVGQRHPGEERSCQEEGGSDRGSDSHARAGNHPTWGSGTAARLGSPEGC